MSNPTLIWLTRPEADNASLADALETQGTEAISYSLINIKYINNNNINNYLHVKHEAILLTSRHALPALKALPDAAKSLPVFCVGDATAAEAKAAGYPHVITGSDDILSLLALILAQQPRPTHLLYLSGEQVRVDVSALLAPQGITVDRQIVYEAEATETLSAALLEALTNSRITAVAFYSPRTAMIAGDLLTQHGFAKAFGEIDAYCLSLAVAEAAGKWPWRSVHACHRPTSEAMRELIVSRFHPPVL